MKYIFCLFTIIKSNIVDSITKSRIFIWLGIDLTFCTKSSHPAVSSSNTHSSTSVFVTAPVTTSTIYSTQYYTITACLLSVTNCSANLKTTAIITSVVPVTTWPYLSWLQGLHNHDRSHRHERNDRNATVHHRQQDCQGHINGRDGDLIGPGFSEWWGTEDGGVAGASRSDDVCCCRSLIRFGCTTGGIFGFDRRLACLEHLIALWWV